MHVLEDGTVVRVRVDQLQNTASPVAFIPPSILNRFVTSTLSNTT